MIISGSVADSLNQAALHPANIILRDANNYTYLQGTISNVNGNFKFDKVNKGNYLLTASYLGYRSKNIKVSVADEKQLDIGEILLSVDPIQISEVEIVYKPIVQYGDDSDVSLNLDMLGDLGEKSVFDVINSFIGINIDFNDKISYDGYTDFTTLIDGQRMGANFMRIGMDGNFQTYVLRRIPAKYIKTVEILPEPKGRYGFFTPIINLIPKGNLRDFYTVFTEAGVKDKYGLGFAVSRVYKKLTLTPELSYKHPAMFSEEEENRENYVNPNTSYERNSNSNNWGIEKRAALRAGYHFSDQHVLKVTGEGGFSESTTDISRNTLYLDGNTEQTVDSRYNDSPTYKYTLNYRKGFYIGGDKSLRMSMNALLNKNAQENSQNITDLTANSVVHKYRSYSNHNSKATNIRLNYYNHKHQFKYLVDAGLSWNKSDEDASREFYNSTSNLWEELSTFSSNQSFSRLSSDLSFKLRRRFDVTKDEKKIFHLLEANISENLNLESISDKLVDQQTKEKNAKTSFGVNYRGHLSEFGSLVFNYQGRISRPTAEQLLETPFYIDNYTIRIGNRMLQPEMRNTVTLDYSWNSQNVIHISNSEIKPPRFGYSFKGIYSAFSNKIVQSHSIDDNGILIYSYNNSSGTKMLTVKSDFYTRISTFMNWKIGVDYNYDSYADNNESIHSGSSWTGNCKLDIRIFKKLKFEAKYQYNSSRINYQRKIHAYQNGSMAISAPAWKNNLHFTIEASNLFTGSGIVTDYYGENFSYQSVKYPESPIIWFRISLMTFKFR